MKDYKRFTDRTEEKYCNAGYCSNEDCDKCDVKKTKFESDHYWRMWQGALVELERAEHRAEVAERALKKFAENIICEDCPFFSDCASSEKMEDLMHSNYCFAEYLKQAEKELAEEGKDEQN